VEAIKNEPDVEVLVSMVESLCQIADVVPVGVIPAPMQSSIGEVLLVATMESDQRNAERMATAEEDQWDDEEKEEAEVEGQKEEELLARIGDAYGAMLRVHSTAGFMTVFTAPVVVQEEQSISPFTLFWDRLNASRPASERHIALCVFDDMVQYGGTQGAQCVPKILPAMRIYAADPSPDVRQAALFGLGLCAQLGGDAFVEAGGAAILEPLEQLISGPHARNEENELATDNAVSALMKILEFQPKLAQGEIGLRLGSLFVNYLPMVADDTEGCVVHAALIRGVERGDVRLLGENAANLPKILAILGETLGTVRLDEEYSVRAVNLVKAIQHQYPADVLQNATAQLTEDQRNKLAQAAQS
jgi:importin-5